MVSGGTAKRKLLSGRVPKVWRRIKRVLVYWISWPVSGPESPPRFVSPVSDKIIRYRLVIKLSTGCGATPETGRPAARNLSPRQFYYGHRSPCASRRRRRRRVRQGSPVKGHDGIRKTSAGRNSRVYGKTKTKGVDRVGGETSGQSPRLHRRCGSSSLSTAPV